MNAVKFDSNASAANDTFLIGVLGIDSQADSDLYGLIELRERRRLDDVDRLTRLISGLGIPLFGGDPVLLAVGLHQSFTSIPIDLAAPATIAIADSMESVFRSGSLISAIFLTCALVTEPTLLRFGVPEPFSTPASFFSRTAAGGVLVMKVKDLSA